MSWNVQNLFDPALNVGRGPATPEELDAKIVQIASVLQGLFGGSGPDLIGLMEVGDEALFQRILAALPGSYFSVWRPAGTQMHVGLGIAAKTSFASDLEFVAEQRPSVLDRPRCLIATVVAHGTAEPLYLVANHWKSRMPDEEDPEGDKKDRLETARWLGDRLGELADLDPCVLCFGDFNAEPFEAPFSEVGLRGRRHVSSVLWTQSTPAYLYNTAWRWLAEPDHWPRSAPYTESRPKTTHDASPAVLFDQLLVSRRLLKNGPFTLQESSVGLAVTPTTHTRTPQGVLKPKRWSYTLNVPSGVSDHFPLVAEFV